MLSIETIIWGLIIAGVICVAIDRYQAKDKEDFEDRDN